MGSACRAASASRRSGFERGPARTRSIPAVVRVVGSSLDSARTTARPAD